MACELELHTDNSFTVRHVLTNPSANPIYVNDAAVTVTIKDNDGDEISGQDWPVTLDYVAASDGIYEKTFAPLSSIVADTLYEVEIDATGNGDGLVGHWSTKVRAKERRG